MARMSLKQWLALWLLFVVYWLLGATLFYSIEHPLEQERRAYEIQERNQIHELLTDEYTGNLEELMDRLSSYCEKPFTRSNVTLDDEDENHPYHWSFYNSVFFSLITASTVGYGNVSPSSDKGKILVIFYSLLGIPFLGIVMSQLGDFFSSIFVKAHDRYKSQVYETRTALVGQVLKYLVPGVILFIVAPAAVIAHMEDWPVVTAVYYTYVTLTTIGYGDFVAGHTGNKSPGYAVYKAVLLFWIMFGLGYLIMILGFISRAMRSKRVIRLERRLAGRIKQTQSKIWNEFVQDVSHVRRLLNEMYLLKVKPVYRKKSLLRRGPHSQSCPQLSEWPVLRPKEEIERLRKEEELEDDRGPEDRGDVWRRRRAYSESQEGGARLPRVMSEGQLQSIDLAATFPPEELPPSFVARPPDVFHNTFVSREGLDLFGADEILAEERMNAFASPTRPRALSECPPDSLRQWALINNMRQNKGEEEEGKTQSLRTPRRTSGLRRMSIAAFNLLSGRRGSSVPEGGGERGGEDDLEGGLEPQYRTISGGERRQSLLEVLSLSPGSSAASISPILEQTSVADLIRAVSSLQGNNCVPPISVGDRRRSLNPIDLGRRRAGSEESFRRRSRPAKVPTFVITSAAEEDTKDSEESLEHVVVRL